MIDSYTHDAFGRVTGSVQTMDTSSPYPFTYQYSLTDQLTQITYPSGRQVGYFLDAVDRVQTIQNVNTAANYASVNYTTAPGNTLTMTMGNGVTEKPSFNDRFQPTGLQVSSPAGNLLTLGLFPCPSGATACASGNNGNLQSQTITTPGLSVTQAYGYDTLNRLTSATENNGSNWTQNYSYVGNGNRWASSAGLPALTLETPQGADWYTSWTPPAGCAPWHTNQIKGWCYDANGNVVQIGNMSRSFIYDAENRQVSANIGGAIASYGYDGLGQRVSKTVGGATITYVYDAFGDLAAEYGSTDPSPCGTPTCYATVDHLGSTRMLTDATGSSNVRHYDYQPFGAEIPAGYGGRTSAMGYLASADAFGTKFTGQFRDSETGLDWFNVRHMSGAQGRFQSVDPGNAGVAIGAPQTWNAYAYVGNNPLSWTDPSGEGWLSWLIRIGSAIASFFCPQCAPYLVGANVGGNIGSILGCGGPLGDCGGGSGAGPWSEQSPISVSVQDPGRFILDYTPGRHFDMTLGAAIAAGMSQEWALDLAHGVVGADKDTQGTKPEFTHIHAMGGEIGRGRYETCAQAYAGTISMLRENMASAAHGNRQALTRSVHAIEDSYSTSHRYRPWNGNLAGHGTGDMSMAGVPEATAATTRFLMGVQGKVPLESAESYLYRPSNCK